MSGREHWAMTAFCAYSLLQCTKTRLLPVILDDGSLGSPQRSELQRVLPSPRFLETADCWNRLETALPPARFPALHAMRLELPLMRKLMDLHAGSSGRKLFLDSDMLFYREPSWLLEWLRSGDHPIYMEDYQDSYGYPPELLETLLGRPILPRVNTGLYAWHSESVDWERLEAWAQSLRERGGINHFSEQCLIAMAMTCQGAHAAPPEYAIRPDAHKARHPSATLNHFVAESRTWYHIYGWPGVLRHASCDN